MTHKSLPVAFCDDGIVCEVEGITAEDDADSAGKKIGTDVLMLLEGHQLVALVTKIQQLTADRESQVVVDILNSLPLDQALWWFIENVSEDSAARPGAYFRLRERVRSELSRS